MSLLVKETEFYDSQDLEVLRLKTRKKPDPESKTVFFLAQELLL